MPVLTRSARRSRTNLPTELVEQILQDSQLDMFDLARCCRVNQKFLSIARPTLYHSIDVSLITTNGTELDDLSLNERGRQLLDAISASPSLGRLPRKINVEGYYSDLLLMQQQEPEESGTEEERLEAFESYAEECRLSDPYEKDKPEKNAHTFEDPANAIDLFLKAMPLVNSLTMNGDLCLYDSVKKWIVEQGDCWVELDLTGQDTGGDLSSNDIEAVETLKLTRLQRLRCSGGHSFERNASFPDNLQILDICDESELSRFRFSPSSQLRVLQVSCSEANLSQILTLRHLERLYFTLLPEYSSSHPILQNSILSAFAKHPRLQFLSIELSNDSPHGLTALPLLSHLPASVIRVEFPYAIPYDALFARLQNKSTSALRSIGIRKRRAEEDVTQTEVLQALCEEKGMRLDRPEGGYRNFRLF